MGVWGQKRYAAYAGEANLLDAILGGGCLGVCMVFWGVGGGCLLVGGWGGGWGGGGVPGLKSRGA